MSSNLSISGRQQYYKDCLARISDISYQSDTTRRVYRKAPYAYESTGSDYKLCVPFEGKSTHCSTSRDYLKTTTGQKDAFIFQIGSYTTPTSAQGYGPENGPVPLKANTWFDVTIWSVNPQFSTCKLEGSWLENSTNREIPKTAPEKYYQIVYSETLAAANNLIVRANCSSKDGFSVSQEIKVYTEQ